jgi:hypothetical protein
VPDAADGSLDPDSGNFSVELRYRTKHSFGNVLQKGQATTYGGQVKFQQPRGKMSCMFKTPQGTATAGSGNHPAERRQLAHRALRPHPDLGHHVRRRSQDRTQQQAHRNPEQQQALGPRRQGQLQRHTVTCDYFAGDIDYVKLTKG